MNSSAEQNIGKESEEIDLLAIVVRLWSKRKFILKGVAGFVFVGLVIAFTSSTKYTSECVMMPQTSGLSSSVGNLSSFASLAGINLSGLADEEGLPPTVYPNIMNNIHFQKELISTPFLFAEYGKEITLLDYYTLPEYEKFSLAKYTIGLPSLIIGALKGEDESNQPIGLASQSRENLQYYTSDEIICVKALEESVVLETAVENDCITISATMPEAILAAQVVNRVQELLQKYVTEFKIEKAMQSYNFIKERYDEKKSDLEDKQVRYAQFMDSNKLLSSASSKIKSEMLKNDYNMASSAFNDISELLTQSQIKVKEDTPIFTIIEPAKVPLKRSSPQRTLILLGFALFGGVIMCGLVLILDAFKESDSIDFELLKKWN